MGLKVFVPQDSGNDHNISGLPWERIAEVRFQYIISQTGFKIVLVVLVLYMHLKCRILFQRHPQIGDQKGRTTSYTTLFDFTLWFKCAGFSFLVSPTLP